MTDRGIRFASDAAAPNNVEEELIGQELPKDRVKNQEMIIRIKLLEERVSSLESDVAKAKAELNREKMISDEEERTGYRREKFANGNVYVGESLDGWKEVDGKMFYANGDIFEGVWRDYDLTRGKMSYANGGVYDGDWSDDHEKHGYGVMTFANGDVYHGEWKYDLMHYNGEMRYANGDFYDGEWRKGCMHGMGKMTWRESGKVYDGEWSHDSMWPKGGDK